MTFLELYKSGQATAEDIDDHIDRWHDAEGMVEGDAGDTQESLAQYLGMTWEEYKHWVETSELPSILPKDA